MALFLFQLERIDNMDKRIYDVLKIEVDGGQYALQDMIDKLDYALFVAKKIDEEQHKELTELAAIKVDNEYAPVKSVAEKIHALQMEDIEHRNCIGDLTDMIIGLETMICELQERLDGGVQ